MKKNIIHNIMAVILICGALLFFSGLSGCGINASRSSSDDAEKGELVISLTDAAGDFASYTVDVLSLTLTKANGTVVETMPISTQIDFAQYTELSEFLTASTVPSGLYKKATLTLDYSDASIWVENEDGDAVEVDTILDENGTTVTTLEVSVHLEGINALLITAGVPAHLALDFDLNASNKLTFLDDGSPVLTVEPTLLADINPQLPKAHRLRGPLKSVNLDDASFRLIIRPFRQRLSGTHQRFGNLKVSTDEHTVYDISGSMYTGYSGLSAMDELTPLTAVVVRGVLSFRPYRFLAQEVLTGSSVPGGTLDVVRGNVISRSENTLKVKGPHC